MKRLTKLQRAEQAVLRAEQTVSVKEARIRVLEGQVDRLGKINDRDHRRNEALGALLGKFKQNVGEFYRVFDSVMES